VFLVDFKDTNYQVINFLSLGWLLISVCGSPLMSLTCSVLPKTRLKRYHSFAGCVYVVGGKGGGRVLDSVEQLEHDNRRMAEFAW
jgi:hypothetical protein